MDYVFQVFFFGRIRPLNHFPVAVKRRALSQELFIENIDPDRERPVPINEFFAGQTVFPVFAGYILPRSWRLMFHSQPMIVMR